MPAAMLSISGLKLCADTHRELLFVIMSVALNACSVMSIDQDIHGDTVVTTDLRLGTMEVAGV
ncbi:hypothetical protein JXR01_00675 [Candidatus Kaiserbacteria bacterium]|nr:MAG: hypothetical protein JXR01_00675 [Candidatus Kaiserbacteria bacterium]